MLESQPDFLKNTVFRGSYDEEWSLRKVLRRFIWHDRIHAKAMYRMAVKTFGREAIPDIFFFVCLGKGRCNLNKSLRKGYRKYIIDEDYFISTGKNYD